MNTSKVYLSLGSNMGESYFYLLSAINLIDKLEGTRVTKVSGFYKTKPWGNLDQDDFINCAIEIETSLLPYALLKSINNIEHELGRERKVHWGPRTIDIDIILYGNLKIKHEKLTVPHRYYRERNFVLIPLADIIDNKSLVLPYIDPETKGELEKYVYPHKILISSCLYGEEIRYDGRSNYSRLFMELMNHDYIKTCPEDEGGLDTPRDPAEITGNKVITVNGADVTKEFLLGAEKSAKTAKENNIKIALMKAKSPSCGYGLIYDGTHSRKLIAGNGLTVEKLLQSGIKIISV